MKSREKWLGTGIAVLFLLAVPGAMAGKSTYQTVLAGKSCKEYKEPSQEIECEYRIGKSLHIVIFGIGSSYASISFDKSDSDGDYYGSVGVLHGCVIVKPGKKGITNHKDAGEPGGLSDCAFISPKNGKVYENGMWEECKAAY